MFPRVDMVISRRQRHSFNIEPFHKAIFALKIETFPSARELWRIYIIINFPSSSPPAAASIVCAAEFHRIMPATSGTTFFFQVSFYFAASSRPVASQFQLCKNLIFPPRHQTKTRWEPSRKGLAGRSSQKSLIIVDSPLSTSWAKENFSHRAASENQTEKLENIAFCRELSWASARKKISLLSQSHFYGSWNPGWHMVWLLGIATLLKLVYCEKFSFSGVVAFRNTSSLNYLILGWGQLQTWIFRQGTLTSFQNFDKSTNLQINDKFDLTFRFRI